MKNFTKSQASYSYIHQGAFETVCSCLPQGFLFCLMFYMICMSMVHDENEMIVLFKFNIYCYR